METIFESLKETSLKVELEYPPPIEIQEKYVEILPTLTREEIVDRALVKRADLFAGPLGFGKPKSEDVEIKEVKEFFKPYWYLKGYYKCKWLNETNYPIPVPDDVVGVKFEDKIIKVKKEVLTISDMLEKIGINLGPISLPGHPIITRAVKAFKMDASIGCSKHIILENVIELHQTQAEEGISLNALTGQEDKEVFELITKANSQEMMKQEKPKINKDYVLEKLKEKFKGVDEKIENEAEVIVERKISIAEIKYALVPWYEVTFQMNQNKKSWRICAVNGKMEKG